MILDITWVSVEGRLKEIAEGSTPNSGKDRRDEVLTDLGLIDRNGVTPAGDRLHMALFVNQDQQMVADALAEVLKRQPIVYALLEALWPVKTPSVAGAVNMLRRLTKDSDDQNARRWLQLLNRAGLVAYNRSSPKMRVLFNPAELVSPEEDEQRERERAHLLSRDTPYGNILALRELLRAARGSIRWWEQHLPPKALEVLYRELDGEHVHSVRLLSGPANVTSEARQDFKRFRKEMNDQRGIDVAWRVLPKDEAREHHDRFFITEGFSRNIPPLNTILAGSTGEILPSQVTSADFDAWWDRATDIADVQIEAS